MARKKGKQSSVSPVLIMILLPFALIAAVPKEAWGTIGVITLVITLFWLLVKRSRRLAAEVSAQTYSNIMNDSADSERGAIPKAAPASFSMVEREDDRTQTRKFESDDGFYTVTLETSQPASFRLPSAPKSDSQWLSAGTVIELGGLSIPGGMLYVGSSLGETYNQEPSLINPKLKVTKVEVDISERRMPYWPSYQSVTPEARRAYLQWLAGGRSAPEANTGYVFLFFYGLERRALVDTLTNTEANADIPEIIAEVERLLTIYGDNRSFRGYASAFLDYLSHFQAIGDSKLYLVDPPPGISAQGYEMPIPLRIGLGQMAMDKRPVDANWALAWALTDPNISRRTPVNRCGAVFGALFKAEYERRHQAGIVLTQNKTKLKCSYRPASSVLTPPSMNIGDLPDVTATSVARKKLQLIVDTCTTELEPYSRYLGRNPDNAEALEGLLQLPATLWPLPARAELEDLQTRIGDDLIVMSFGELAGRFKSAGALSRDKVLALARALESLKIGMEPDVLAGSKTPKPEDRIALFVTQPEDGVLRATPAYNAASVTLDLASAVASADGDTSHEEVTLLSQHIDSWGHLSVAHRKRLKAHLRIQLQQPPTLASLKKKLDPLAIEAKRAIASFLAHLAHVDGTVSPSEVKLLERVYKALQLDPQLLYGDLHGAAAGVSRSVSESAAYTQLSSDNVKKSAPTSQGFVLNHERIAQLQRETAQVSALLAKVFTDEQVDEPKEPEEFEPIAESTKESDVGMAGLDPEHSAFLRLIISRTEWSRTELEAAASDMELMLDGALEQINDMAFEHFDMPVTEGDEPVEINADILDKLAL